jgi:hypothetical protein
MNDIQIEVDSVTVDPACVRFIYQEDYPSDEEHNYTLRIVKDSIDPEMLTFADLSPTDVPYDKQVRNWVYWLGHIVSRFCDPNDCTGMCWVINDVQSIAESQSEYAIRGRCSPWISKKG